MSLAEKISDGTASDEEIARYNALFGEEEQISKQEPPPVENQLWQNILASIEEKPELPVVKIRKRIRSLSAAAAILVVMAGSAYWYISAKNNTATTDLVSKPGKSSTRPIVPGSDRAILTLADGSSIVLDSVVNHELARQQHVQVSQEAIGQLNYHLEKKNASFKPTSQEINTLSTPVGGQFRLVLSDGTRVWLNASSTISYPAVFTGPVREVTLTGEAYFEVAKNTAQPFRVVSGGQQLEVLGTSFNLSSYPDDNAVKTTLLEGKVSIRRLSDGKTSLLQPGQQVELNERELRLSDAEADEAVAWKNGYFMFSNENVESVMRKIARWYDVEIIYQGNVSKKALWGSVSRFKNIEDVLKILELTESVHFKLQGRTVLVRP